MNAQEFQPFVEQLGDLLAAQLSQRRACQRIEHPLPVLAPVAFEAACWPPRKRGTKTVIAARGQHVDAGNKAAGPAASMYGARVFSQDDVGSL